MAVLIHSSGKHPFQSLAWGGDSAIHGTGSGIVFEPFLA